MKKLLALITAVLCLIYALAFSACESRHNHIFNDEIAYKVSGNVINVGYSCTNCGEVPDPQETVTVDHVANTANDVTAYQQSATGDVTILLKAGDHLIVYALARTNGKTRIIAEDGARIQTVSLGVDTKDVIIENFDFQKFADVTTGSNIGIHLATGAQDVKIYSDITIKNCTFKDGGYINGAWTKGIANSFIIENNVFDHTGYESSNRCGIQIEEVDGNTVIRNNVFKNICYSAIRLGTQGSTSDGYTKVNGKMLIENNVFVDIVQYAIQVSALYEFSGEVKGNVFDTNKTLRVTKASDCDFSLTVGANTWRNVPDSVSNATSYDPREQEVI